MGGGYFNDDSFQLFVIYVVPTLVRDIIFDKDGKPYPIDPFLVQVFVLISLWRFSCFILKSKLSKSNFSDF